MKSTSAEATIIQAVLAALSMVSSLGYSRSAAWNAKAPRVRSSSQRLSVSPGGTRRATCAPQLAQNFIRELGERPDLRIGHEAERIERRVAAIDPVHREAERLRAERVPAIGGNEADRLLRHTEPAHGELIDLWRRLVDLDLLDAQHGVEAQPGVAHERLEHVGRAVRQDRLLKLQPLERMRHFRKGREAQVF